MWLETLPDSTDPLRQGDYLIGVQLPTMKLPLPFYKLGGQDQMAAPATITDVIVVSQCCDNTQNDHAAVVPVRPLGGLQEHQVDALLASEPVDLGDTLGGYSLDYFNLEPLDGRIPAQPSGRYLVAVLHRVSTFQGDCAPLLERRVARMTVESRRLLRIKLGLLWSRAEAEDVAHLQEQGLPAGLTPRPPVPD